MTQRVNEYGFPIIETEPEPMPTVEQVKGVWDAIDPCAFLCYAISVNALPLDAKVKETLNAYGWLNEDGFPDYDKMRREFERCT